MRTKRQKRSYIIEAAVSAVIIALLFFSIILCGGAGKSARAVSERTTPTKFESQGVLDDLSGMTIDGKAFSLADYPANENGSIQLMSFVEYCYAYNADMRGYYGLYVYIYNPKMTNFDFSSGKCKVEFRAGTKSFAKYELGFLSCSMQSGYESRFLKLKVKFTEAQRSAIFEALDPESRVYEVSGIELLDPKGAEYPNAHDYPVGGYDKDGKAQGLTFTYTGYASGYDEKGTSKGTLSMSCDGLETVELKPHHTTYRPKGTKYSDQSDYRWSTVRDSLSSVYFAVPKNLRNYYDELYAVHATWLEAWTSPMLVTGNKDVYDNLLKFVGDIVDYSGDFVKYPMYEDFYHIAGSTSRFKMYQWGLRYGVNASRWGSDGADGGIRYGRTDFDTIMNMSVHYNNPYTDSTSRISGKTVDGVKLQDKFYIHASSPESQIRLLEQLSWLFYSPGGVDSADRYCVESNEVYEWANKTFDNITNGMYQNFVNGGVWRFHDKLPSNHGNAYYAALFDDIADEYREENIEATKEYPLTSYEWTENYKWWKGHWYEMASENPTKASAIYEVTDKDFEPKDRTAICDNLFVSETDYDEFKSFYDENRANNRIYLFRFDQSEYISTELTQNEIRKTSDEITGIVNLDTNAYMCKEKVYLDFDIIDITVKKDGELYVIGVVMSPIDIFPNTMPPVFTHPDATEPEFWKFAVIVGVITIAVFIGARIIKTIYRKGVNS